MDDALIAIRSLFDLPNAVMDRMEALNADAQLVSALQGLEGEALRTAVANFSLPRLSPKRGLSAEEKEWGKRFSDGRTAIKKRAERANELLNPDFAQLERELPAIQAQLRGLAALVKRTHQHFREEKNARNYLEDFAKENYAGKRILLVEDNALNREIATEIIGMTGVTIDIAENGKIAVEKVMEAPEKWYDLIFMDIQMPIMNGYEATAAIRALAGSRGKVPIIAMTANAFAEDVQLARNTGMNEHIAKPLDLNKLNDVLKQWL